MYAQLKKSNLIDCGPKSEFEQLLEDYVHSCRKSFAMSQFQEEEIKREEGQLLQLPLDNQMSHPLAEEEETVGFSDHILIGSRFWSSMKKKHSADSIIFTNESVVKFLNLVLLSLSNNPHIGLREKYWYLDYFVNYFLENKDLII